MEKFQVTREEIVAAARSFLGIRFLHQGRDENGLDCVGFLVAIGKKIGYPEIFDVEGYRRVPSADTIRETLRKNCDEIKVENAKPGDIFLMRMGGIKPRHTSVYLSDEGEPQIIHAGMNGVRIQPFSDFPPSWFVAAFRLKGIREGK
jgi:cell wall-associated NlpC family hydrolase